ncbi:sucrose-6-phosphate hydrolase [Gracilibacillus sp. S3-1-1]|uniref:Sucrose-6-phosphate hydrolase n=1 Tax=Gracilibacillus pellucidus TaxID=3095368 RepID=A0ACC6M0R2_9BACI|nr:sucrose-6-phosphate hydrolase [Gracilibacillus sp. S3-1-1]MDX8044468.1 sucrose-6-phosphate hydrolase [Gracilibacillus sp. S3-1-1]
MYKDQELRQQARDAVEKKKAIVSSDPYRPIYHIAAPTGLINDPNGWVQWNGVYHLFYQWMPFKTDHGAKFWGHVSSQNLVDWQEEEIALTPSDWFDKDGCYSGSAIEHNGQLKLFYTGNVKNDGVRETYQCLAVSNDGIHFEKKGVQIELPEGFTAHFRDPKVWEQDGEYYMVIGAQTDKEEGAVVLYQSEDLSDWQFQGILAEGFGYMWECPDFFSLDGYDILLFSPQGLDANGIDYRNTYQSGYVIGSWQESFTFGEFHELDRGFEFYAPQTTIDDQGRRLLFGWMGVPDQEEEHHPTKNYSWMHQLTIPRELVLENGKIYQQPVAELMELRDELIVNQVGSVHTDIPKASELVLNEITSEKGYIKLFDYATIEFDQHKQTIRLTRPAFDDGELEERVGIMEGELTEIRLFIDHSSLEIFINGGEVVFTSRMFSDVSNRTLEVEAEGKLSIWSLKQKF